ncbi:hypothetical protein E2C01_068880 [Portunus trituberculatus]|uniref:Uncharacterized protein n=1 Tax=Portunus trituberculatus TaxID=210409 RepID=A0A5B7HQ04_PORTR|nr:hypothetical protein [Portunus trituberculatus]
MATLLSSTPRPLYLLVTLITPQRTFTFVQAPIFSSGSSLSRQRLPSRKLSVPHVNKHFAILMYTTTTFLHPSSPISYPSSARPFIQRHSISPLAASHHNPFHPPPASPIRD